MNTFNQHIDKKVIKILRLDANKDYTSISFPIAIFIMLNINSGLLIDFNMNKEAVEIKYLTLEDLEIDYGTEFWENYLNELNSDDPLNKIIGQKIKVIKLGRLENEDKEGNSFVIKIGYYAGIAIILEKNTLVIDYSNDKRNLNVENGVNFENVNNWDLI